MGPLPYKKVFKEKPQLARAKDLPDFPAIFSSQHIVLKDDFFRIVSERNNQKTGKKDFEVKLTMYYNVFVLPFGYDTLRVYLDNGIKKTTIKSMNLFERLNPREHEIISYIQGMIKYAGEATRLKILKKSEESSFLTKFFSPNDNSNPINGSNMEGINKKFPEINFVDGIAYLYKNSYYEDVELVNRDVVTQRIPLTRDFKEITKMISEFAPEEAGKKTGFQEQCYKSVFQKVDPLQCFIKSNFIKSNDARNKLSVLTQEEKSLISEFMKVVGITPTPLLDDSGSSRTHLSNVALVNTCTNLKKITSTFLVSGLEVDEIENISVSLTKRNKPNEVFQVQQAGSFIREQMSIARIGKSNDLGNYPISLPRNSSGDSASFINDVVIEKKQFLNKEISAFSFDRSVSLSNLSNGGFHFKDLKKADPKKLTTTFDFAAIADNSLRRDFVSNIRTGEFLLNSTISPNKSLGHYKRSRSEQDFSNVKAFATTNSRNDLNYFPTNVIKLFGIGKDVKVSKVICEPLSSGSKFQIPLLNPSSSEIKHVDPVAGTKYKYYVYLYHENGDILSEPLVIQHATLRRGMPKLELNYIGNRDQKYAVFNLEKDSIENVAKNIQKSLEKAFSNSSGARNFYTRFFEEKINENLQNIGNVFQLYVELYYPKVGQHGKHFIIDLKTENDNSQFLIPLSSVEHSSFIVSYNLMISNPLEVLSNGFEKIEEKRTREIFRRRTAAFFNSFTSTTGTLPVSVTNSETGREEYSNNSKFSASDPFNKVTCIGGTLEFIKENSFNGTRVDSLKGTYIPDEGDCVIEWKVIPTGYSPLIPNKNIDFFVVTAEINSLEIPIDGHPFVNFNYQYKIRTFPFLGVASKVKFKVYTVYSDYTVEDSSGSVTLKITDTKKHIQES